MFSQSKKHPFLAFSKKYKMTRYRIRHKLTGQTVEVSANNSYSACRRLGWDTHDCYVLGLGMKSILLSPKWFVRPEDPVKER